ncbi:unnamed protein product [Prunus armeniaca]|uniref:Uncharacterized protein n=1 Tax=Prunus armeniaca TaxID=36596 RepID=A0A6J5XRK0_PRUAR|nr:unnamed protein product [Prunus armeniaca]
MLSHSSASESESTDEPHAGKLARVVLAGTPDTNMRGMRSLIVTVGGSQCPGSRGLLLTETRGKPKNVSALREPYEKAPNYRTKQGIELRESRCANAHPVFPCSLARY